MSAQAHPEAKCTLKGSQYVLPGFQIPQVVIGHHEMDMQASVRGG